MQIKRFGNWKISTRIFLGFGGALALNFVFAVLSLQKFSDLRQQASDLAERESSETQALADLRFQLNSHRGAQLEYLAARNGRQRAESEKHVREAEVGSLSAQEKCCAIFADLKRRQSLDQVRDDLLHYLEVSQQVISLARASDARQKRKTRRRGIRSDLLMADLLFGPEQDALNRVLSRLQARVDLDRRAAEDARQSGAELYAFTQRRSDAALALGAGVGLLVALAIVFLSLRPVRRMIDRAEEIARGSFSGAPLEVNAGAEAGNLAHSLNQFQAKMQFACDGLKGCGERAAAALDPLSTRARQQDHGGHLQQKQALEISIHAEKMAAVATEIFDCSRRAAETACESVRTAGKGAATLDETLTRMQSIAGAVGETSKRIQRLGKSSEQIGQILSVIDDIAKQTNLLALNASIEAARAGEHGRGFAVVAGEVTKLAERTSKATKEIKVTMGQIRLETQIAVKAMAEGSSLVESGIESTEQASGLLRSLVGTTEGLNRMVNQIAAMAAMQPSSREEIGERVKEILITAKESCEGAAQITGVLEELSRIATELQDLENHIRQKCAVPRQGQEFEIRQEKSRTMAAEKTEIVSKRGPTGPALAAPVGLRPGVAKIHARLLTPVTDPPAQLPVPSGASARTRA